MGWSSKVDSSPARGTLIFYTEKLSKTNLIQSGEPTCKNGTILLISLC